MLTPLIALLLAFGAAWWGTGRMLRFAIAKAVLDIPNERSSHSTPTPRGGGLAIVVVVIAGLLVGAGLGWIGSATALALVPGGALIALVSWLDDRSGVPPGLRFATQTAAAIWVVVWLGPLQLVGGSASGPLLWIDGALTVLALVWMANLFNFMDGIDGLAAGEAVVVGLAGAALALLQGDREPAWIAALLAVAAAGFLPWNWSPARIFMGDVGSVFLGFLFGALGLVSAHHGHVTAVGWLVLLGVFVVDATVTLLRRIVRGERWFAAHRGHAYQRAVQAGASPALVSGAVMAVDLVLGAVVWAALSWPERAPMLLAAGLLLPAGLYLAIERARPL